MVQPEQKFWSIYVIFSADSVSQNGFTGYRRLSRASINCITRRAIPE